MTGEANGPLPRRTSRSAPPSRALDSRAHSGGASWNTFAALVVLGLALSGCATAYSSTDLRLEPIGDTIYLHARSDEVSRNLCASLGGDVTRVEGRLAPAAGRTIQLGRVGGCYTLRHVIVCSEGDAACLAHEERHRQEGAFHR